MSNNHLQDAALTQTHLLQVYAEETQVVSQLGRFVTEAMEHGEGAVVAARRDHWVHVADQLGELCQPSEGFVSQGRLVVLDAEELADQFVSHGELDAAGFSARVQPALAQVRDAAEMSRVRVFGEVVNVLWERREVEATQRLEAMWSELMSQEAFTLLCAYRVDIFDARVPDPAFAGILESHHYVVAHDESGRRMAALERAIDEVLGPGRTHMVRVVSAGRLQDKRSPPTAEWMVAWLRTHMPHHAVDVLRLARKYVAAAA